MFTTFALILDVITNSVILLILSLLGACLYLYTKQKKKKINAYKYKK